MTLCRSLHVIIKPGVSSCLQILVEKKKKKTSSEKLLSLLRFVILCFQDWNSLRNLRKQKLTPVQSFIESLKAKIPSSSGWCSLAISVGREPGGELQRAEWGEAGPMGLTAGHPELAVLPWIGGWYFIIQERKRSLAAPWHHHSPSWPHSGISCDASKNRECVASIPRDSDSTDPVGAQHLCYCKDSNVQPGLEPWLLTGA